MALDFEYPPKDTKSLAAWFAEGVRAELKGLEKKCNEQRHELLSGKRLEYNKIIFQFTIAEGNLLPQEANGKLKVGTDEYDVTIVWQDADLIHILINDTAKLPDNIPRAELIIDDTALLRKLAETLEQISDGSKSISPYSTKIFHWQKAKSKTAKIAGSDLRARLDNSDSSKDAIKKSCGSEVTYIWGPPGTGKTFTIAHLIANLIHLGERVLVTSHTHVAVDQALYESIKSENNYTGPLANSSLIKENKFIRFGHTTDHKIPDDVKCTEIVKSKAKQLTDEIDRLEKDNSLLEKHRSDRERMLSDFRLHDQLNHDLKVKTQSLKRGQKSRNDLKVKIEDLALLNNKREINYGKAQRAWFRREKKVLNARILLEEVLHDKEQTNQELITIINQIEITTNNIKNTTKQYNTQKSICDDYPQRRILVKEVDEINHKLALIEKRIIEIKDQISGLEKELLDNAQVIFCTLTKIYTAKEMEDQIFDVVIIDEISMALPPLIFLASGKAERRSILVGDFLQLPPIVRSDEPTSNARLGIDTFRLSKVTIDNKPNVKCHVLTTLDTQRRMSKDIAEIARILAYNDAGIKLKDHDHVRVRELPEWINISTNSNSILIVDTSDLHCWSGKQVGSLSRFNFYTAILSIEIASLAAKTITKPEEGSSRPIGIVTPYAAQKKVLSSLVNNIGLEKWVKVGTIHTFQGGEADLIIFDSVLDEPYWSSRLSNPNDFPDVIRDLNVAVTRAKYKLVFIGSSEWLNKNTKINSGLGKLWDILKDNVESEFVSALSISKKTWFQRVTEKVDVLSGWDLPSKDGNYAIEPLDENTFFSRFCHDLTNAKNSIFGFAPYFGHYRWPKVEPYLRDALHRNVEVTILTPDLKEVEHDRTFTEKIVHNLRSLGAVIVSVSGIHAKDVIIDERIIYTGSLNWSSHRGMVESVHRIAIPEYAKKCLELMQAKHIHENLVRNDGLPRKCPNCGELVHIVNQRKQHRQWDLQALKIGCTNPDCQRGYLRDINERPPLSEIPTCQIDKRTLYRKVKYRRSELWECPKHPKKCSRFKAVPGDPEISTNNQGMLFDII